MLLIITHKQDYTVDFVVNQLNAAAVSYYRLNCDDLLNAPYHLHFSTAGGLDLGQLAQVSAVWFRRVKPPQLPAGTEPHVAEYVAGELLALLHNLYLLLDCKWVSQPAAIYQAENKLYQLKIAGKLGFTLPDTLVTNERSALLDFYQAHAGEVIIKPLFNSRPAQPSGQQQVLFTNRLDPAHLTHLDRYTLTPSIYQRNIAKAYEVRVTIVGTAVFAAAVDSQTSPVTHQDWRRARLPFRAYELPPAVAQRCVALVEELHLRFGAIDLIRSVDGQYYFLEINPNGQWAWLEMECGLPISQALITELTT
jgi:glutathione synthase/RimK-type ligase-like ATP-grasp enzyme